MRQVTLNLPLNLELKIVTSNLGWYLQNIGTEHGVTSVHFQRCAGWGPGILFVFVHFLSLEKQRIRPLAGTRLLRPPPLVTSILYRLDFTNFVTQTTTPLGTCLDTFTVSSPSGATSSSASPLCGTNTGQHSQLTLVGFLNSLMLAYIRIPLVVRECLGSSSDSLFHS